MHMCVCVCMSERERERELESVLDFKKGKVLAEL